jgi:hypothetical protein
VEAILMKLLLAAALLAAATLTSVEPAYSQACYTAEACRTLRLQQQAAQLRAAAYAQQQADIAARQQKRAEIERRRSAELQVAARERARIDAEIRAAESREAQARAIVEQQESDARAMALAAQQRQEADERWRAATRQAKLETEQLAAAQREAYARARLAEETRVANLRAAKQSPDNYCKEPAVAGYVIEYFNSLARAGNAAFTAVDIEHLITEQFDARAKTISCHGTFVLTNGMRLDGSIVARPNVAGNIIFGFHATQD